jgi:hypothetical protein
MAFTYVATASKACAVTASITGNFLDKDALCLVVAKLNHFEIYTIGVEGLKAFMDVPIYGDIAHIEFFRPKVSRFQSETSNHSRYSRVKPRISCSSRPNVCISQCLNSTKRNDKLLLAPREA